MAWQQLKLRIRSEHGDFLERQLLEQGAISISYLDAGDQAVFQKEPGVTVIWDESILVSLYESNRDLNPLLKWLQSNPVILNADALTIETIEDQVWERSWMADFQAMQFGQRLWICPSWQTPPDPAAINIILDPGMAFGSGSHVTTGMCLRWLESANLAGTQVIDYGCGSGVLAIASALLGARHVVAVDHDPQAIVATRANSALNGILDRVLHPCQPDGVPDLQADVLLANILAEPLIELAPHFASLLRPGGALVLSGLLADQIESVSAAYEEAFQLQPPLIEQQWVRLSGVRFR